MREFIGWILLIAHIVNSSPALSEVGAQGREGFIDKTGKIILSLPAGCHAKFPQYFSNGLAVVQQGNAFGYVDKKGDIVINAKFEDADPFSEGLAAVRFQSGKYGYIDPAGKIVIEPKFDYAAPFFHNIAMVKLQDKVSYINRAGKLLCKRTFDGGGSFSIADGLAPVRIGNKWGYIDATGKVVIAARFDWAMRFNDGLACVGAKKTGNATFINTSGKVVFHTPRFVLAGKEGTFLEGMAAIRLVEQPGKTTYITKNGSLLTEQFDNSSDFHEGLASVRKGKMCGYINKSGKPAFNFGYTDAFDFSEGLAAVSSSGKWGYLDKNGAQAITPQFTEARDFKEGVAFVVTP